jgi:hypothetical protein
VSDQAVAGIPPQSHWQTHHEDKNKNTEYFTFGMRRRGEIKTKRSCVVYDTRVSFSPDLCDASADIGFAFRVEQPGVARRGQRDEGGAGAVG